MSAAADTIGFLKDLVACDTRNPPREPAHSGIFERLADPLDGFELTLDDHGDGCIGLLAVRGKPDTLFNFHVDTVPTAPGWTRDPFDLEVGDERATGLGACDIKGAAACMLSAARRTSGPLALLFTSDEEAGTSRCVRRFLAGGPRFDKVIVAEPTECRAVTAHRGIVSARARFSGGAGHASELRAHDESAIHRAAEWATRAVDLARGYADEGLGTLTGLPFNIGRIEGGDKPNMIAAACELRFGFRPLPGQDATQLLDRFAGLARDDVHFETVFRGPALPNRDADTRLADAAAFIDALGVEAAPPVSFWTEASLISAAGATAIVLGPGSIAQAHTADEWVALDQLDRMTDLYIRLIDHG